MHVRRILRTITETPPVKFLVSESLVRDTWTQSLVPGVPHLLGQYLETQPILHHTFFLLFFHKCFTLSNVSVHTPSFPYQTPSNCLHPKTSSLSSNVRQFHRTPPARFGSPYSRRVNLLSYPGFTTVQCPLPLYSDASLRSTYHSQDGNRVPVTPVT